MDCLSLCLFVCVCVCVCVCVFVCMYDMCVGGLGAYVASPVLKPISVHPVFPLLLSFYFLIDIHKEVVLKSKKA